MVYNIYWFCNWDLTNSTQPELPLINELLIFPTIPLIYFFNKNDIYFCFTASK